MTFQQRAGGESMSHVAIWERVNQIQQGFSIWALLTVWVRLFVVVGEAVMCSFSRVVRMKEWLVWVPERME